MRAWVEKLKRFWSRRGFYVLTALCLALIAAAAVYGRARLFPVAPAAPARQGGAAREASGDVAPALTAAPPAPTEAPAPALSWPVAGREILRGYAGEPAWFEPLGLYEVHPGVDIRAEKGEGVFAAADGTVAAAAYEAQLGYMVETSEGGLVLRYGNLDGPAAVRVGERVHRGRQIGRVGASAPAAGALGAHLHFEAFFNGENLPLP
jgi:murein DD-endopeptidase MepM/ murein hydrolase activator NlpD